MFQSRWSLGGSGAEAALALRRRVFVEEQGIAEAEEFDSFDQYAAHLTVEGEKGAIAAGRLYPHRGMTWADRICVAPEYRGEPYGDLALRLMLLKAGQLAGSHIAAHLTEEEAALYLPFGFSPQGGAEWRRGAPRTLYALGRDCVIWDSPCKHM